MGHLRHASRQAACNCDVGVCSILPWGRDLGRHLEVGLPPSTKNSVPVMKLLWPEARKSNAAASSSGLPTRPIGILAASPTTHADTINADLLIFIES
jgi:hypothetical protein